MELSCKTEGSVAVIAISGRLVAANASDLTNKFSSQSQEHINFVLDLSEMEYIDSTGLGAIVSCLKKASEKGGNIKLACIQEKPRMIFEITRAYRIFDIYDDVATAINSYN